MHSLLSRLEREDLDVRCAAVCCDQAFPNELFDEQATWSMLMVRVFGHCVRSYWHPSGWLVISLLHPRPSLAFYCPCSSPFAVGFDPHVEQGWPQDFLAVEAFSHALVHAHRRAAFPFN